MTSKVSGMLKDPLDPIIQAEMLAPNLIRDFPAALPLITKINKAHVLMLLARSILSNEHARRLAGAILDLEAAGPSAFVLDPAREDPYFNYEATLIERVGSDIGGRVHIARSRNDLYATMDRLRARTATLAICQVMLDLRQSLNEQIAQFSSVVMPGYTHLQPAQPVTFGYHLAGFAHALERDYQRIVECLSRTNVSPLGAGAMAGTSFPIDREVTARSLGFEGVGPHAQDCIASRDYLVELLSGLALTATTLSRMAQDFFVMTTYEFQTLELPDSVAQTSSMMPQKKNMSALEVLRASAAQVLGAHVSALSGLRATHYSFGFDACCDPFRWTWDALDGGRRAVVVARVVVEKCRPRPERALALARANFSTATDLADLLVREAGLSFREAHHLVGDVVRTASARGLTAEQIDADLVAEQAKAMLGKSVHLSADLVAQAVDPELVVQARRNTGGPSNHDVRAMLNGLNARLKADRSNLDGTISRLNQADATLENAIRALAGRAA
ncbi:MAG: argininosuccinate lyase [Reyranella sp.]|nr:argininosuccinate lyase [Reyranella sp.]